MHLTLSAAKTFVRSRKDELGFSDSDMLADSLDDRNLGRTVEECLPEAISYIHMFAPTALVEGSIIDENTTSGPSVSIADGVLDVDFTGTNFLVMRMLSFRGGNSNITLPKYYEEDSPQARMQNDRYVKGAPDEPMLIRCADSLGQKPHFKYYSLNANESTPRFRMTYVSVPQISGTGDAAYYEISPLLDLAILNYLTSLVCAAYSEFDKAKHFAEKAHGYFNQ